MQVFLTIVLVLVFCNLVDFSSSIWHSLFHFVKVFLVNYVISFDGFIALVRVNLQSVAVLIGEEVQSRLRWLLLLGIAMQLGDDVADLVTHLTDGLHLLVGIQLLVIHHFLSELSGSGLNLLLSPLFFFAELSLPRHDLVDLFESLDFLSFFVLLGLGLSPLRHLSDVLFGLFAPLLKVDLVTLSEIALDAKEDLLESLVGEALLEEGVLIVDVCTRSNVGLCSRTMIYALHSFWLKSLLC